MDAQQQEMLLGAEPQEAWAEEGTAVEAKGALCFLGNQSLLLACLFLCRELAQIKGKQGRQRGGLNHLDGSTCHGEKDGAQGFVALNDGAQRLLQSRQMQ